MAKRGRILGKITFEWNSYLVELTWGETDGRAECIGVAVRGYRPFGSDSVDDPAYPIGPRHPVRAVTRLALRELPLGAFIASEITSQRRTLAQLSKHRHVLLSERAESLTEDLEAWGTAAKPRRGPRRRYGPAHYAEVAAVYADALDRKQAPTQAVAEHFGKSESTASKWLARARELGLLAPTSQGRTGGVAPAASPKRTKRKPTTGGKKQ